MSQVPSMGVEKASPEQLLRLDLACPIPWRPAPGAQLASANVPASPTPKKNEDTVSAVLMPLSSPQQKTEADGPVQASSSTITASWLARRYAETLWLGEHHSPLVAFLRHVSHLEAASPSPTHTANDLRSLLRTRQHVRQRLNGTPDKDGYASRHTLKAVLEKSYVEGDDKQEKSIVNTALSAGPASAVAAEVLSKHSQSVGLGRMGRLWINAIETRELQLQVLVVMCLLRLTAEHPSLTQQQSPNVTRDSKHGSDASVKGDDEASPQPQQKKRKRKAERSQRWTGRTGIFPWQMGRSAASADASTASEASPDADTSIEPKALSKRFEQLIDALCLRVATTSISLDLDNDAHKSVGDGEKRSHVTTPNTPGESPAGVARRKRAAGHRVVVPPFGSEGRRREGAKDERDVMQWFCCHVVETHFARTLPRQCGTVRSRCYVPSAMTPAKARPVASDKATADKRRSFSSRASQPPLQSGITESDGFADVIGGRQSAAHRAGPLQRSLLDEDRSRLQRTQSFAAAKHRTKFDAREVNVRRRWERSHSVGPTMGEGGAMQDEAGIEEPVLASSSGARWTQQKSSAAGQEQAFPSSSREDRSDSQAFTLVLSTPSKARPVNVLQARKRESARSTSTQPSSRSQLPSAAHARPTASQAPPAALRPSAISSPWRRSESQPVLALEKRSLLFHDRGGTLELSDGDLSDEMEEPFGMNEVLDESLMQTFSDDEEDDGPEQADVFGSYMHWLAPSATGGGDNASAADETAAQLQDDEDDEAQLAQPDSVAPSALVDEDDEEGERVVLSKRARSMAPALLNFSLGGGGGGNSLGVGGAVNGVSFATAGRAISTPPLSLVESESTLRDISTTATSNFVDGSASQPLRPLKTASPRRSLSGRNPFAIS